MKINSQFLNLSDPGIFELFGGTEYWERIDFPSASVVLREEEGSKDFYYIVSGSVRISKTLADRNEKELAILQSGDFFGENSFLSDGLSRTASVMALTDCVCLKLTPEKFEQLLKKDSEVAAGILLGIVKGLNLRLRKMNERLMAVYEMSLIVRQFRGDLQAMMQEVFAKLSEVLGSHNIILFGMDGSAKYKHPKVSESTVMSIHSKIPDYASRLNVVGAPEYFVDGDMVFITVRNIQGVMAGIFAMNITSDKKEEDIKFLLTVVEQIGHVLG